MNTLTPDMHRDSDFKDLYSAIKKRLQERPSNPAMAASASDKSKSAESAKPTSTISASNNSIGLGNIHIGGNVDGNIVIGNNNQVTKE